MNSSHIFNYFFSLGAGLATGIAVITIPALAYYPKIANRLRSGIFRRKKGVSNRC